MESSPLLSCLRKSRNELGLTVDGAVVRRSSWLGLVLRGTSPSAMRGTLTVVDGMEWCLNGEVVTDRPRP